MRSSSRSAGLKRLGLQERATTVLSTSEWLPSLGQGVVGIEIRETDTFAREKLGFLNHMPSEIALTASALSRRRSMVRAGHRLPDWQRSTAIRSHFAAKCWRLMEAIPQRRSFRFRLAMIRAALPKPPAAIAASR